ncbi:hypothetical protein HAX54_011167 [Datura stramonium]|uniref:Pentatricopeptide repeat-containing protein n=1 Tax=Datura stramonium TaxID=4076 RepID=A0ABS8THE4_DATST|nr:hypothetical protein [Datura stramonium]
MSERLSSKVYNYMLGILGSNGLVREFWSVVEIMRVKKLKELYGSELADNSARKFVLGFAVICGNVWGDAVEKQLRVKVEFSSELISMVLEKLECETNKALIFFRWIEESGLFKHNEQTFNAIARVFGREESSEKFWKLVDEMRTAGFEMERETYIRDCTFLLKKIVVNKELDLDLFSKVLRVFTESGNSLTGANLDAILKSLTSVDRFGECNKILKAMERCCGGKDKESNEFMNYIESTVSTPKSKTWTSLIEGYCEAGDLAKASDAFEMMVEKEGSSHAGKIIGSTRFQGSPGCSTFDEKSRLPTFSGSLHQVPFQDWKCCDALAFTAAVTVKKLPSTSVFLTLFEAYFKAGRQSEAQDFLAICPRYIRNHADVLNLFFSMKPQKTTATIFVTA